MSILEVLLWNLLTTATLLHNSYEESIQISPPPISLGKHIVVCTCVITFMVLFFFHLALPWDWTLNMLAQALGEFCLFHFLKVWAQENYKTSKNLIHSNGDKSEWPPELLEALKANECENVFKVINSYGNIRGCTITIIIAPVCFLCLDFLYLKAVTVTKIPFVEGSWGRTFKPRSLIWFYLNLDNRVLGKIS